MPITAILTRKKCLVVMTYYASVSLPRHEVIAQFQRYDPLQRGETRRPASIVRDAPSFCTLDDETTKSTLTFMPRQSSDLNFLVTCRMAKVICRGAYRWVLLGEYKHIFSSDVYISQCIQLISMLSVPVNGGTSSTAFWHSRPHTCRVSSYRYQIDIK